MAGLIGRVAARTAANATERADTRGWSSLPAEILLARFRLPVGPNEIQVTFQGPDGPETTRMTVDIEPGTVTIRNVSVWGRDQGDQARFIRSQRGVDYTVPRRQTDPTRLHHYGPKL